MKTIKLKFPNKEGEQLAARLEMPVDKRVYAYALFAHCFTCSKNLMAVTHISRALTARGIAVLRFDFTGLGESEGDFEDTNFSSNVSDLIAAANYLEEHYQQAQIIIGHSLGGAAVLMAAAQLKYIKAIATIGAPADPTHVTHLFQNSIEQIESTGKAEVSLGGRPFTIKKQFVNDLAEYEKSGVIKELRRPLLIMHSPQDDVVDIKNAEKIYVSAMHPKSYVSLDGADHLLTNKGDAAYVGQVIAAWASRYVDFEKQTDLNTNEQVVVRNEADRGLQTEIMASGHFLLTDEPEEVGGTNLGATPYDLLVAALGACTAMTIRLYANHKKWPLEEVKVHLTREKRHANDARDLSEKSKIEFIDRYLELSGNLTDEQRKRITEIADKCPVHKTLTNGLQVNTTLKD
ncbi:MULTISPECIES: bifunctional alpha/beta hydrolase/OsmC family protein [unclassified Roseivirga]|uniref:bifunctional alpha/beta hydrolase/OsmC family protein n=1 Tax=unclassified Roseivirga TaxID=2626142 RepID=UPI00257F3D39|nr:MULTISPECIES: bifunctional alpha/beta hydrolase/OsmC family protein [unclassified Roseivirga]MEC7755234.1 bifunctional alpha/beta hydrolase/OsmC family protein [Bacteroidota bacterium]|tara:strand:- start:28016 stop:29227 length:1212 start_codon:yes stop_codon:yes gene_type:complete